MKKTTCIITVLLLIILACVGTWIGLNVHSLHRDPKKDHTPTRLGRDHIIKDKLAKESAPESSQESVSRNELANKESPAARKVEKQELKEQKKTEIGKDVYSDTHGTIVERPLIEKQPSEDTSKYKPPSTHTISHTDKNIAKEPRGDKTSDPMKDVEDIKRSLEETDQLEKFKAETENSESIRKMVSEINQIIKPGKDWVNVQQERVKIEKMVNEAQKLLRSSKPSTDGHTSITQNKLLNSDMNETIRKEREDLQKITDEIISTLKEAQRIEKENKEKEEGELQIQPKENDIKDKSNSDSAITDNGKGSSTKIKKKTKKPKGLSDGDKLLKEIIEKDAKENKALEEMAKITKEQYANV